MLYLNVSTPQVPELHLDVSGLWTKGAFAAPERVYTTGTWASPGRTYVDYRSMCCSENCLHYRGLCSTWMSLQYTPWPNIHLDVSGQQVPVLLMGLCSPQAPWVAPGRVYTTEDCMCSTWTCLLYKRPDLHVDFSGGACTAPGRVYTTGAWAAPWRVYLANVSSVSRSVTYTYGIFIQQFMKFCFIRNFFLVLVLKNPDPPLPDEISQSLQNFVAKLAKIMDEFREITK